MTRTIVLPRTTIRLAHGAALLLTGAAALAAPRPQEAGVVSGAPIRDALAAVDEEVRVYNDHLTILASPWMEGRLPGTRGMELAKEYMEYWFRQYGLSAPYSAEVVQPDGTVLMEAGASYRQPFDLGDSAKVERGTLAMSAAGGTHTFRRGSDHDFTVTSLGTGGAVSAPLVFVGYGIEDGPDGYTSFADGQSIEGKVAVVLRFEPFREEGESKGWSQWRDEGRTSWSAAASFASKMAVLRARGAAGVVVINTPGVADNRGDRLYGLNSASVPDKDQIQGPVVHLSTAAGRRLVELASGGAHTLEGLTAMANAGERCPELEGNLALDVLIDRTPLVAENIVAVLPGKGSLAEEKVVIGAHLDHLGMGDFGSRDREYMGTRLHPGADDNATGCAGILLIAQKMARDYAAAPADTDLRTIVFIAFSAEESGLNGSAYYAENPLGSLGSHKLMMNFDMIGRMTDKRVKLSGTWTADGLDEFVAPITAASPLTVVEEVFSGGGSDHQSFYLRRVPVLFSIIADMHPDYHTSRDVSPLINRVEAVHAANLFYDIASAYAKLPTALEYVGRREIRQRMNEARERDERGDAEAEQPPPGDGPVQATVRLGVRPVYEADDANARGVLVGDAPEGSPAAKGGVKAGDRILKWGGKDLEGASALAQLLREAKAGDVVRIEVERDGATVNLEVTLEAR